jgi:hypothetical protein
MSDEDARERAIRLERAIDKALSDLFPIRLWENFKLTMPRYGAKIASTIRLIRTYA